MENTTIAAISTAYGEAGIGIVRMSGPDSFEILKKVFKKKNGKSFEFEPRHMYYGVVKDEDSVIDEALGVFMKGPYTYTGEDVAEIQCHGGNISVKNILSVLLRNGAVLADRGEFTKRAFISGKIEDSTSISLNLLNISALVMLVEVLPTIMVIKTEIYYYIGSSSSSAASVWTGSSKLVGVSDHSCRGQIL